MIFAAGGAWLLASLAGCVMHETYGDPGTPEGELALVEGYWHYLFLYDEEIHIASVDGKRKRGEDAWFHAYSVSLPAGKHWLELAVLRNSGEVARCAFEWSFDPRHRYKIRALRHDQFLLAHPATSPFKASVSMEASAPSGPDRLLSVPAVCATSRLCRQDSDCAPKRACRLDAAFDFGTCRPEGG